MLATMNLQLLTTLTTDAPSDMAPAAAQTPARQPLTVDGGFADLLRLRAAPGPAAGEPRGEFLPRGGNELPAPTPLPSGSRREPLLELPAAMDDRLTAGNAELAFAAQWPAEPPVPEASGTGTALPGTTLPGADLPESIWPPGLMALVEDAFPGDERPASWPLDAGQRAQRPAETGALTVPTAPQALKPPAAEPPAMPQGIPAASAQRSDAAPVEWPPAQRADSPRQAEPAPQPAAADGTRANLLAEGQVVPRVLAMPENALQGERPAAAATALLSQAAPSQSPATANVADSRAAGLIPGATGELIRTPVGEPGWGDRIGERVLMMAGSQTQQAEIRLTPAELGPVRVRISMEEGAAHVTFQAQHAVTREAIEAAMPRLRDMLAENGLSLGQASVGGDSVAEGQREGDNAPRTAGTDGAQSNDADELAPAERQKTVASDSLVDTFA